MYGRQLHTPLFWCLIERPFLNTIGKALALLLIFSAIR